MKKSTKILTTILVLGFIYSVFELITGHGGSGLYDFIDALTYSSIVLFLAALIVLLINIPNIKSHWPAFIFLLVGLPLTVSAIRVTMARIEYNREPDLAPKYPLPVSREQYLFDSTNIQLAIDSMIAFRNKRYGGPDILHGSIDTIIYSQKGDKVFVSYINKFEPNDLGNDLDPDYFAADKRDSVFWELRQVKYSMSGSFYDKQSLKKAVRKFYFNQFTFLDKDSASENYFWKVIL